MLTKLAANVVRSQSPSEISLNSDVRRSAKAKKKIHPDDKIQFVIEAVCKILIYFHKKIKFAFSDTIAYALQVPNG